MTGQESESLLEYEVANPSRTEPMLHVLVLDEELPYPPDSGKRIRTWNLLKELAPRHQVTYLCYADRNCAAQHVLRQAGIQVVPVAPRHLETGIWLYLRLLINCFSSRPFSVGKHDRRRFHRRLARLLQANQYDLIHCEWTPYAQFAFGAGTSVPRSLPVVIATHNIEAEILRRRAEQQTNAPARKYFQLQAARMERFERSVFARAQSVIVVSENDRKLALSWGARHTWLVANGVPSDFCRDSLPDRRDASKDLLFLGSLDWFPNVDAIRFFLADIFPLVRMQDRDVTLSIVGRRPDVALRKLIDSVDGATLVGEVPDVRPHLCRAAAVIVPLRIGGGTRIKILEAMAAGKIVVSTSIGAEGLEVDHDVHLLIADSPAEFAAAIQRALDPHQLAAIPDLARNRVLESYTWTAQAKELEKAWLKSVSFRPN